MPGYGTNVDGPLLVGTRPQSSATTPWINDYGPVQCTARGTIVANGSVAVSGTIYVPIGSVILDITEDTTTAWNGSTAVGTVGTVAADTTYAPSTSVAAAGRSRPTFTGANLLNMGSVVAPGQIVFTVTPTGATSAGQTVFTLEYSPTVQPFIGNT